MILKATKCFCANFLSKVKEKNGRYFLEFKKKKIAQKTRFLDWVC
jgi:hypothetical protein